MNLRQHKRARQALQERSIACACTAWPRGEAYFEEDSQRFDESPCPRCHGDGRDPWTDYLMPCPLCEGDEL